MIPCIIGDRLSWKGEVLLLMSLYYKKLSGKLANFIETCLGTLKNVLEILSNSKSGRKLDRSLLNFFEHLHLCVCLN